MVFVTLSHSVEDYDKWKPVYDGHEGARISSGCKSANVYVSPQNKNKITVLFEWDTKENFQRFSESEDLKNAMMKAGVQGPPDVKFLE
jgi:heme-degrading monooxygenase HmoA